MIEAKLQAHYAAQWVARYGRSYLMPQKDDSHTAMLWNRSAKMFLSLSSKQGALAFDIPTLTLFWLDPRGSMGTGFSLDGKTDKEVEGLLRAMLGEVGLSPMTLKNIFDVRLSGVNWFWLSRCNGGLGGDPGR